MTKQPKAGAGASASSPRTPTARRPVGRGRIVAVRFEDGTELPCTDDNLRRYLRARDDEAMCDALLGKHASYAAKDSLLNFMKALQAVRKEERSAKSKVSAALPRNEFARRHDAADALLRFKEAYEIAKGKIHGWGAAADAHFLIDPKTRNAILKRAAKAD